MIIIIGCNWKRVLISNNVACCITVNTPEIEYFWQSKIQRILEISVIEKFLL